MLDRNLALIQIQSCPTAFMSLECQTNSSVNNKEKENSLARHEGKTDQIFQNI